MAILKKAIFDAADALDAGVKIELILHFRPLRGLLLREAITRQPVRISEAGSTCTMMNKVAHRFSV